MGRSPLHGRTPLSGIVPKDADKTEDAGGFAFSPANNSNSTTFLIGADLAARAMNIEYGLMVIDAAAAAAAEERE